MKKIKSTTLLQKNLFYVKSIFKNTFVKISLKKNLKLSFFSPKNKFQKHFVCIQRVIELS